MATVDSSIALRVAPSVQLESPVNQLARVMQLQGLQQQNQLAQMQMDAQRTDRAQSNQLMQFLGTNPDLSTPEGISGLYRAAPLKADSILKSRLDTKKAGTDAEAAAVKLATDRYTVYKKTLGALSSAPDLNKDMVIQAGQELVSAGILPPSMLQSALAGMPDDPNQIRMALRQGLAAQLTPEQVFTVFAPKPEKFDTGQQIITRDMNPNSPTYGQNTGGAPLQRQATPGDVLSAETTRRGQNMVDARARERLEFDKTKPQAQVGPDGRPVKPMPATALKMQNEALDMIGIASSIQADLGTIEQQLNTGALDFGPVKNLMSQGLNMAGMSNEQSRNYSTFKSSMEKLRNDSLRLNKGVQTDGDAQRAWNELFQNINDSKLVAQRLKEIKAINARAVDLRKREVEDIRNNYNQPQYDFSGQTNVPSAVTPPGGAAPASGPARVTSDADYNALPSGTEFVGPDGKRRRKP